MQPGNYSQRIMLCDKSCTHVPALDIAGECTRQPAALCGGCCLNVPPAARLRLLLQPPPHEHDDMRRISPLSALEHGRSTHQKPGPS